MGGNPKIHNPPLDPAGLFSEGAEAIKLRIEGSLTIPETGIKMV